MDEVTATKIYKCLLSLDPLIDELGAAVDKISEEAERHQFRTAVGKIMGTVYSELTFPLECQFPSLVPDEERPLL